MDPVPKSVSPPPSPLALLSPEAAIAESAKALRVFRWITGAVGVLASAAVVIRWGFRLETLVAVGVVLLLFALALLCLQWVGQLNRKQVFGPARLMAWAVAILFVGAGVVFFSAAVSDWPWPVKSRIAAFFAGSAGQPASGGGAPGMPPVSGGMPGTAAAPGAAPLVVEEWIRVAEESTKSGAVAQRRPLPHNVLAARVAFEGWWAETPLSARKTVPGAKLHDALEKNIWIYREQEVDTRIKPASFNWADQAIAFFREAGDRYHLAAALMDKAAVYIDVSDMVHTQAGDWQRIAADGDTVMKEALALADVPQQASGHRLWSRFYYNLARPLSGNLSDPWDATRLAVSYEHINTACERDPADIRNLNQLGRTAMKVAGVPENENEPQWTARLWAAQARLAARWKEIRPSREYAFRSKISTLNVLAVLTLEAASRDYAETPAARRREKSATLLRELKEVAIPAQRDALALALSGESELRDQYDYDMHYDLARTFAMCATIMAGEGQGGEGEFTEAVGNLRQARAGATDAQRTAALKGLEEDAAFKQLSEPRRRQLRDVWQ